MAAPSGALARDHGHECDHYCVIGNPVEHSRSPWIHARFAGLTGHALHYDRLLAPLDGFEASLRGFIRRGGKGCNVTVPFKADAARLADIRTPRVELAQAANTLLIAPNGSIRADNTDGLGLLADLTRNAGLALAGRRVLLLGAGGAAAGVLGPLLEARPGHLTLSNRTLPRAEALASRHAGIAAACGVDMQVQATLAVRGTFDLVVNATAASLHGEAIALPASVLYPGTLVYDMMYGPAARPFLDWAKHHGATGRDGLGMLVEQAAAAFALWRGVAPPTAAVLQELRAMCAA